MATHARPIPMTATRIPFLIGSLSQNDSGVRRCHIIRRCAAMVTQRAEAPFVFVGTAECRRDQRNCGLELASIACGAGEGRARLRSTGAALEVLLRVYRPSALAPVVLLTLLTGNCEVQSSQLPTRM